MSKQWYQRRVRGCVNKQNNKERRMSLFKTSIPGLKKILNHKYQSRDDSILYKYVLGPFWNYILQFVPMSIAPNLITLTGTITLLINFLAVALYAPTFSEPLPTWAYVSSALTLLFYQTLDNLDGKQARRTGSSSPLGQLFDHGCDSIVITIQAVISSCVGRMGIGWISITQLIVTAMVPFWLATWEEYHTGILHLGVVNGPDEGIIIISFIYLLTAYIGPDMWLKTVPQIFGLSKEVFPSFLQNMQFNTFFAFVAMTPIIITCFVNIQHVTSYLSKKSNPKLGPAFQHVLTGLIYVGCISLWFYTSTTQFGSNSVWISYPRITFLAVGLGFGEMVSRLILAHMTDEPFEFLPRPLLPLLFTTLCLSADFLGGFAILSEKMLFIIYLVLVSLSYYEFVKSVITHLCKLLGINVLTIPLKKN
eukprot:TRINITY_DN5007_c0_g3_i1.p1 TRINITY_DN5007_c0_g3~~TRINITY_DN5007_c0_g3_i1.p1  ORF type:complete len:421 (+),score=75.52 TRINITY_DN5007_c0_g3_i1:695-1957(+)